MPASPNADEAAAIAATIQRFVAETAVGGGERGEAVSPWQRAALVEGVGAKAAVQEHLRGGAKWLS
jgi:hypothetical protein